MSMYYYTILIWVLAFFKSELVGDGGGVGKCTSALKFCIFAENVGLCECPVWSYYEVYIGLSK